MSKATENSPDNASSDAIQWPSLAFYWGAFRRQFLFSALLALPCLAVAALGISRIPLIYSSSISAMFDVDLSGTSETIAMNRFNTNFTSSFADIDFFRRIKSRLPKANDIPATPSNSSKIKEKIKSILPQNLWPSSWSQSPEEAEDLAVINGLKNSLSPSIAPSQFTISVDAKSSDPEEAKNLAEAGMNQFIEDELLRRHKAVLEKIRALSALESKILKEKETNQDSNQALIDSKPSNATSDAQKQIIKTNEQSMIKDIFLKFSKFGKLRATQEEKILALENELNNLLSRRGPPHPEVTQKQREINALKFDSELSSLEREIERLKTQLFSYQRDMLSRGIPIDRSVEIAGFSDDSKRNLISIAEQMRNLEILANGLQNEINNPSQSSHFTIIIKPEIPRSPSNIKQFVMAGVLGLMFAVLVFLISIITRELSQSTIVASEQLSRRYSVPTAIQIKRSWLKRHPLFDADQIRELKPQLSQLIKKRRPELLLLDAYRHLAQLIEQTHRHQIIMVFDVSHQNHDDNLASNLIKAMAVDSGRRALLLSFRGRNNTIDESGDDLMKFLSGKVEWKDVRFKGSKDGSHDSAFAKEPTESLASFRVDLVKRLFESLREKYQIIVVEGFLPAYNSENGILQEIADSIVLQIRLGESRHEDLERILHFIDKRKIAASFVC